MADTRPAYDFRPLGLGEILDYTFRIYQRVFPYVAIPTAILQGIFIAPLYFFLAALQMVSELLQENPELLSASIPTFADVAALLLEHVGLDVTWAVGFGVGEWGLLGLGLLLYLMLATIAASLLHVLVVGVVGQRILGQEPTAQGLLQLIGRFGWRAIAVAFLQALVMTAPFIPAVPFLVIGFAAPTSPAMLPLLLIGLLLLLPAYIAMIWLVYSLYLTEPALVVEDLSAVAAIRRAFQLVRGHWWRIFGVTLVMGLIVQLIQSLIIGVAGFLLVSLIPRGELAIMTTLQVIGHVFLVPLTYVLLVLIYFDIRVRSEQFDLYFLLGDRPALQTDPALPTAIDAPPAFIPHSPYMPPALPPTEPPSS